MDKQPITIHDEELADDEIIKHNQRTRLAYVRHKTHESFPEDPKEMTVILAAMSDMDRAALGNKRIGANEKQAAADALVANAINQLSQHYGSENPFAVKRGGDGAPELEHSQIPDPNPVPGETDIGISEQTYDDFIKKFED